MSALPFRRMVGAIILGMAMLPGWASAETGPRVVVSIKPIHSLVAGVMEGVGEPVLLVDGTLSPHGFALKPSHAEALENADVVFWIGPFLEAFLDGAVDNLDPSQRAVSLLDAPGMQLLPVRDGAMFEAHAHDHDGHDDHSDEDGIGHEDHDEHEHEHEHEHQGTTELGTGSIDQHVWLDPRNAVAMVRAAATALSEVDPGHEVVYRANAARLTDRLNALIESAELRLRDVRGEPFVVFHDAYRYFEYRFGLNAVGSVTLHPDTPPSAERIREVQEKLVRLEAACIFSEPQFPEKLVAVAAEGSPVEIGILDPLGAAFPAGPDQYFETMEAMVKSVAGCLSPAS